MMEGLWLLVLALVTGDRWNMTQDMWYAEMEKGMNEQTMFVYNFSCSGKIYFFSFLTLYFCTHVVFSRQLCHVMAIFKKNYSVMVNFYFFRYLYSHYAFLSGDIYLGTYLVSFSMSGDAWQWINSIWEKKVKGLGTNNLNQSLFSPQNKSVDWCRFWFSDKSLKSQNIGNRIKNYIICFFCKEFLMSYLFLKSFLPISQCQLRDTYN